MAPTKDMRRTFSVLTVILALGIGCVLLAPSIGFHSFQYFTPLGRSEESDQNSIVQLDTFVPDDGMYFLETSSRPFLNPKQLCAVESAAFHHSKKQVVIAVGTGNLINTPAIEKLQKAYRNIRFVRYQESEWFKGTVLANWWKKAEKKVRKSQHTVGHLSDILRVVLLYKHGGIYLDLDIILMQDLRSLPINAVPRTYTNKGFANALMLFEAGHPLLEKYLKAITAKYNPKRWDFNGPVTLSSTLIDWCGGKLPQNFTHTEVCNGVYLLPNTRFYLPSKLWKKFYLNEEKTSKKILAAISDAFLIHHWNHYSDSATINATANSNQAVGIVARQNCPVTASAHGGFLWGYH